MPYNPTNNTWDLTPSMERNLKEKHSSQKLQERKHQDWDGNYTLYRNKVVTNRLTQRQAVNIPLMKETIKTQLSKIDDPPEIEWKEKGGDEVKELVFQEVWNENSRVNKLELIDIIDKKNVLLYGFSVKKLNITKTGVTVSVLDTYDTLFDPTMNPWDIESARYIIHQNIFRTVRDILADPKYTEAGKNELKIWADSPPGIVQNGTNREEFEKKMERLKAMGINHSDFAHFAGGDRLVNLTEHFTKVWDGKKFEKRVIVYADDKIELLNLSLEEAIGVDFWPFVVWSEDPETNDVYPDSIADLVRTPNKVLNVWFSQMIENRTLKNFQMHWYTPMQGYTAQTYTPGPGMMLAAPPGDDINKVLKPVEISGLEDTLAAIQAVVQIVERGSGTGAIDKGQSEQGQQTLGEVQLLVGKANERTVGMAKFYRIAWYELACKWRDMLNANPPKSMNLFKVGKSGKVFPKMVYRNDWVSEAGYEPIVRSTSEQEIENTKGIQKWMFILKQFPNNQVLREIGQKRMLEVVDLTPEELRRVTDAEKQLQDQMQQAMLAQSMPMQATAIGGEPAPAPTPVADPMSESSPEIRSLIEELANV